MSTSGEKKPSVPSSHITVKVQNQKEKCVFFRIKKDTELRRMMEAFSVKVGMEMSTLKFFFDGVRIKPDQTPNELKLEDGDEIDALAEQIGGCSFYYPH